MWGLQTSGREPRKGRGHGIKPHSSSRGVAARTPGVSPCKRGRGLVTWPVSGLRGPWGFPRTGTFGWLPQQGHPGVSVSTRRELPRPLLGVGHELLSQFCSLPSSLDAVAHETWGKRAAEKHLTTSCKEGRAHRGLSLRPGLLLPMCRLNKPPGLGLVHGHPTTGRSTGIKELRAQAMPRQALSHPRRARTPLLQFQAH